MDVLLLINHFCSNARVISARQDARVTLPPSINARTSALQLLRHKRNSCRYETYPAHRFNAGSEFKERSVDSPT